MFSKIIVHVHTTYCNFNFFMQMETPMVFVFLLLNGTQYARPKKWRYAVRNAKIERYAVRKGEGVSIGVSCNVFNALDKISQRNKYRTIENIYVNILLLYTQLNRPEILYFVLFSFSRFLYISVNLKWLPNNLERLSM